MNCKRCRESHWVCEKHPDRPMGHDGCKAAGDPRPVCNPASADHAPTLSPGFETDTEWLPEIVTAKRRTNGVMRRGASCVGAPWTRQDDYDLRYLLEWEERSEAEVARFLQREPREIEDRIRSCTQHGGWRPPSSDDNVINLLDRVVRKRWHK